MKIGVVVAMKKELMPLLLLTNGYKEEKAYGCSVYTLSNADVTLILSGVGEIQSAMAASILITKYNVERIINYGYAGATCNELESGDLVNVTSVVHCDMDLTVFGNLPGQYDKHDRVDFPADEKYFSDLGLPEKKLSSSDRFLDPGKERDTLSETFGQNISDMEGAGIAVVCTKANIPFSILKCISNSRNETHSDYKKFSLDGIAKCVQIIYTKLLGSN